MERWSSLNEKKEFEEQQRIRKAAPELLEALEELLYGTFPDGVDDNESGRIGFSDACVKRYNKAKSAIAAARGNE